MGVIWKYQIIAESSHIVRWADNKSFSVSLVTLTYRDKSELYQCLMYSIHSLSNLIVSTFTQALATVLATTTVIHY